MFKLNIIKLLASSIAVLPWLIDLQPSQAQSITPAEDGTGTIIQTPDGKTYQIEGGTLSGDGANLFHSFEELNLDRVEIANFLSNPEIRNILGRVIGGDASLIDGLIQVTGGNSNLYLMNPAGIVFGNNASLNVPAAFTATTSDAIGFTDGWFNAVGENNYQILTNSPNSFAFTSSDPGSIVNSGDLTVGDRASLTLLGGEVVNTGNISAPKGKITIAAVPGENLVRVSQAGMILSLEVVPTTLSETESSATISPLSLPELLTGGEIAQATGVSVDADGTISLTGSGETIPQTSGTAIASGNISARQGGEIQVFGDRVGVIAANLDASGTDGGGTVLVGGDYQGGGTTPTADVTYVSPDSSINVSAINKGDGGQAIVWSDNLTAFNGEISATGGETSGDGGFVEVSGKENLIFEGTVDASATNGEFGTLLLDPKNIAINPGTDDGEDEGSKANALSTNQNAIVAEVLASQPPEDGTFNIFESELEGMSGDTNIILQADNNITINDLPDNQLLFKPGSGSITFTADADSDNAGSFKMSSSDTIRAEGRNVEISGDQLTVAGINTSALGNGGNITLSSSENNIIVTNGLNANSRGSGTGGQIDLEVTGGVGGINISSSDVTVTSTSKGGDGGEINLSTNGGNIVTLNVDTSVNQNGTGGDISYNIAQNPEGIGQIDTSGGVIDAGSLEGDGGNITMTTFEGNISTSDIDTNSGDDGLGGTIDLTISNNIGQIDTTNGTLDSSSKKNDGGNISLSTDEGNISAGNITSLSDGGVGGQISLEIDAGGGAIDTTVGTLNSTSAVGDGGIINLSTNSGNIATSNINSFTTDNGSTGGEISLQVQGDSGSIDTTAGTLKSGSTKAIGGDVTLSTESTTTGGNIQTATINTSSNNSDNGGRIKIAAGEIGNIDTSNGLLNTTSKSGNGGNVYLTVREGGISPGNIDSSAGDNGAGGGINLTATSTPGLIDTSSSTLDSSSKGGNGGNIVINSAGGNVSTADLISGSQGKGNGGNITINIDRSDRRIGNIDTTAGTLDSSSKSGNAGDVSLTVGEGGIDTSTINSSSNGNGNFGGDISLTVENTKGSIDTTTGSLISGKGKGSAGDIDLATDEGNISTSDLTARSTGSGTGGAVNLQVNQDGDIDTSKGIIDSSSAENSGGNVSLTTAKGNITTSSVITSSEGTGTGGNIAMTTDEAGSIGTTNGTAPKLDSSSATGTGGDVNLESSDVTVVTVDATGGVAGGDITLTGDEIKLADGSTLASNGGELQLRTFSIAKDIRVNGVSNTDALDILRTKIDRIADGFSLIEIGRMEGTGTIFIIEDPDFPVPATYLQPTQNN